MEEQIVISKMLYDKALGTMGDRIRMARSSAGFSQLALGQAIEVSQNHVSDLEQNRVKDPGLATLRRIAEVTGVSIQFLLPELGEDNLIESNTVTVEAERAARIIDSLPEEERQVCLDMVKTIQKRFVKGTKENRKRTTELLDLIERQHGREMRQIIEADLGAFLGIVGALKLKEQVKRERVISQTF